MRFFILLTLGVFSLGAVSARADSLDNAVMQKIDSDHKADVAKGSFARQKALAKANLGSKRGERSIASTRTVKSDSAGDETAARILGHETSGDLKLGGTTSSNAKTVAKAPPTLVKAEAKSKGSSKPSVAKR